MTNQGGLNRRRTGGKPLLFDREIIDGLAASLSSYLGHCKSANSFRLVRSVWQHHPFMSQYFDLDPKNRRLISKDKTPKGFPNVRRQYAFFRLRLPADALFFQVGRFIEFYQEDDARIAAALGLTPLAKNRRKALFGFPVRHLAFYRDRLLAQGASVAVIREWPRYWTRIKERELVARYVPLGPGFQVHGFRFAKK